MNSPPPLPKSPRRVGKYLLLKQIGRGGMADIWLAETESGSRVALKTMRPEFKNSDGEQMFAEEARVGSVVQHPNLCAVLDFGEGDNGAFFMVLEYIDGSDLSQIINAFGEAKRRVPWEIAAHVVSKVAHGLSALHTSDVGAIVHRDVSPNNIRITSSGLVKLLDLGVARAPDRGRLTPPNYFKGKAGYASPELTVGWSASVHSDLYACGIVLWEALAGRRLFEAKRTSDALMLARSAQVPPIELIRPDVPRSILAIVNQAMAPSPDKRLTSAKLLIKGLDAALEQEGKSVDAKVLASVIGSLTPSAAVDPREQTTHRPAARSGVNRGIPKKTSESS